MNMHNLFPTPIGMFDLDRELTDEEFVVCSWSRNTR
jgi:hypothetical protein